ncbi:MAG TPA: ABC transporter permease [Gemmatimonadales bacterium]|nr:ABC transporter permease [Gemmatimonadales bacterium]
MTLVSDIKYAFRGLRNNSGFAAVAILTLALGIGANTAIFSVVNAVLLRPLPYAEPERLVQVYSAGFQEGRFSMSYPDIEQLRAMPQIFGGVAGYDTHEFNFTGSGDPREIEGAYASSELFTVLGITPELGRTFGAQDEQTPYVVISHRLWASVFGRDPTVLGRSIQLDGIPFTVIGVMPATFRFPSENIDLWAPLGGAFAASPEARTDRNLHLFNTVARLQPGVTKERVQADLATLAQRLQAREATANQSQPQRREMRITARGAAPAGGAGPRPGPTVARARDGAGLEIAFDAVPLTDEVVGDIRPTLYVLFGTVAMVLLIACANAANLLVARANSRRREIVIRQALGADRGRIVQQILTESVLIALAAGVVGVLMSYWGLDLLLATWPDSLPRVQDVTIDRSVLAFTFLVSLATGIGFGLVPALRAFHPAIEEALREDSGGLSGGRSRQRTQRVMVAAELAVALVLLVSAGLLIRSFTRLMEVDPGYDTHDVLAARVRLTPSRYTDRASRETFFRTLSDDLAARPGVDGVTISRTMPLTGSMMMLAINPQRIRPDDPDPILPIAMRLVGSDYFNTLRVPILKGRPFEANDRDGATPVVVINTRLAKRLWPDEDPVGKQLPIGMRQQTEREATVVGVIGDVHYAGLDEETGPELYLPLAQAPDWGEQMWIAIRAERNPLLLAGTVREAVRRADPQQPVAELFSLDQAIGQSTAARRFNMMLISLFAGLAVVLSVIGVYGLTSYAVSQRTRELGIRIALGAKQGDVVRLVIREGLRLALIGAAIGLPIAFAASKAIGSMLFEVTTSDALTYAGTAAILISAAVLATWIPARRAARVDPVVALKSE